MTKTTKKNILKYVVQKIKSILSLYIYIYIYRVVCNIKGSNSVIYVSIQDVVLQLLKEKMMAKARTSSGFIIDGYPREMEQGLRFEKEVIHFSLKLSH